MAHRDLLISTITLGNTMASLVTAFNQAFQLSDRPQLFGVFPKGFCRRTIGPDNQGRQMQGSILLNNLRKRGAVCVEHDFMAGWLGPQNIAELAAAAPIHFSQHKDVTAGLAVPSYDVIVEEALRQSAPKLDLVVVPVGAGVLFEETVRYVEKCSPATRVIGVTTLDEHSIADKIYAAYSQYMRDLVAHGRACYPGLPRHQVVPVPDVDIIRAMEHSPRSLRIEPSAAAAFAILTNFALVPHDASVLVINTGDGIVQEPDLCP